MAGDTTAVHGRVSDAQTGEPIAIAMVHVRTVDRRAVTDAAGAFVLRGLPPGMHLFEVSRLGYETYAFEIAVRPDRPILIELHPEPLVLEGITVALDQFGDRARRIPYRVYAWDEATLVGARHTRVVDFLSEQPWLMCPGAECNTWVQGRARTPFVFIDEMLRDWAYLDTYRTDQLYRIESIRNCPMVRIYTKAFMERVARGDARLPGSFVGDCVWVRHTMRLRLF